MPLWTCYFTEDHLELSSESSAEGAPTTGRGNVLPANSYRASVRHDLLSRVPHAASAAFLPHTCHEKSPVFPRLSVHRCKVQAHCTFGKAWSLAGCPKITREHCSRPLRFQYCSWPTRSFGNASPWTLISTSRFLSTWMMSANPSSSHVVLMVNQDIWQLLSLAV